jgi:hypothetical protein
LVAKSGFEEDLARRASTNLYNRRPAWLALAREMLDKAVAAACGWTDYTPEMPGEEILGRLLDLDQKRIRRFWGLRAWPPPPPPNPSLPRTAATTS